MCIVEFDEAKTPSKSVSVELSGYANFVGLTRSTGATPAMQIVSELPPPTSEKHMPTSRSASDSADRFSVIDPATTGPHDLANNYRGVRRGGDFAQKRER
ncbi:unnamed protein product [Prorocentrum cordatum]|uniref:Uncharacterized protein n=1 Tax=Prorocentrum cordatum TaxID=2364126 RepID=A0ABN9SI27_9DINO|nr:unnamed protein product [Polarella glacialis]